MNNSEEREALENFEEKCIETNIIGRNNRTIIKVSNFGRIQRKSGKIEFSYYRQLLVFPDRHIRVYKFIAEKFIPKTKEDIELNRNQIDHITHNPIGMNINDVRNLRWCTQKENVNFYECKRNMKRTEEFKELQRRIHTGVKFTEERKHKIGIAQRECIRTEFGKKYREHFGITRYDNNRQYDREYQWYKKHGFCKWEK